ncbi:MAG TPA: hypothetical protein VFV19_04980 [Candidatus Polarisedimenticolaceae bacterium]|nr:hypothetical protein [Candidatus Polarisedimenticolaceae bacterium]
MAIPGGSAFSYARDIAEGFQTVTERSFKGLTKPEMDQLAFEIDRALRDIRAEQPATDDLPMIQARNRKIQRLNGAMVMMRSYRAKVRI